MKNISTLSTVVAVKRSITVTVVALLSCHLLFSIYNEVKFGNAIRAEQRIDKTDEFSAGNNGGNGGGSSGGGGGHRALVIGAAGFLGFPTTLALLGHPSFDVVVGVDNMNAESKTSSINVKKTRWKALQTELLVLSKSSNHSSTFVRGDACDREMIQALMREDDIDTVFYLASQDYVRHDSTIATSTNNSDEAMTPPVLVKRPFHYPINNIDCFVNVLEIIRTISQNNKANQTSTATNRGTPSLVYESITTDDRLDIRTEASMELIAKAYQNLYNVSSAPLRYYNKSRTLHSFASDNFSQTRLRKSEDDKRHDRAAGQTNRNITSIEEIVQKVIDASIEMFPRNSNSMPAKTENSAVYLDHEERTDNEEMAINFTDLESTKTMPKQSKNLVLMEEEITQGGIENSKSSRNDLCFVTAMFTNNTTKNSDPIKDITYYNHDRPFRYFFFTNVYEEEGLPSPGWERIVIPDLPFERMITQSRWPKFMGWMHPSLQTCRVVIYTDAIVPPRDISLNRWINLANKALKSPNGLYQRENLTVKKHHSTIFKELDRIVRNGKDTKEHVEQSKTWFMKQGGFQDKVKGYYNMFLIYDPTNPKFQELMTTFWAAYSSEEMSWRDQPLYRHVVNKLQIFPTTSGRDKLRSYFPVTKSTSKAHIYVHQPSAQDTS